MNLRIIKQNFVFLSMKLDLQDLLPILVSKNLLTHYDYESLQSKSRIRRNQEFLLNLDMYGDDCEKEFYKYLETLSLRLKDNETHFIAGTYNGDKYIKVHSLLRTRINAAAIAPKLYEYGYLNLEKLEKVLASCTQMQKASELIENFDRAARRPGFMSCFLETLKEIQPTLYRDVLQKLQ